MDAIKTKKLGLSLQIQDLSTKNERNQRIAYRASTINTMMIQLKQTLKRKNHKLRILTNNLAAMKAETETLCLHIYKMDSMLLTTTNSMEKVLKVIFYSYQIPSGGSALLQWGAQGATTWDTRIDIITLIYNISIYVTVKVRILVKFMSYRIHKIIWSNTQTPNDICS